MGVFIVTVQALATSEVRAPLSKPEAPAYDMAPGMKALAQLQPLLTGREAREVETPRVDLKLAAMAARNTAHLARDPSLSEHLRSMPATEFARESFNRLEPLA